MEPLYAALAFAAVAFVAINVGRLLLGRLAGERARRQLMARLEPHREATEEDVAEVEKAYGARIVVGCPIYEVIGPVETMKIRGGTLFSVGGVAIAPESVVVLADRGIALEDLVSGGDDARTRRETDAAQAERLGDEGIILDRYASAEEAKLRHVELCFADGDDPTEDAGYVLSFDGRRIL